MSQEIRDGKLYLSVGEGETAVCDFCSDPNIVKDYDCTDYVVPVKGPDGRTVELGSAGKWAACKECAELVDKKDKVGLEQRAFQTMLKRSPWMENDSPEILTGTRNFLHELHQKFWEGMRG